MPVRPATDPFHWIVFIAVVMFFLAVDLGVFHRKARTIRYWEALGWTLVWFLTAMVFGFVIAPSMVPDWHAEQFAFGYLIELALSMDNVFVMALIFAYFRVPNEYQHRVLFWGILGALLMRGALIAVGAFLLAKFHFLVWIFGAFLVVTGVKMALHDNAELHPEKNPLVRLARKIFRVTEAYEGQAFFVRRAGRLFATPLFLVLLVVESMDLVFAMDSVPAIFAVTSDPFLVYTSNVFAILGLRSLYFLLAGIMGRFVYLKLGLSVILVFVGLKMAFVELVKVPVGISLGDIGLVLAVSVVASLLATRRKPKAG